MFSNRIANSAKFLQMPTEAQLLYFHMVMRADDDGVVEAYPLLKLLGVPSDNFKVLITKGFIKQLNEDQVVVITEWLEHNTIRADRKVNSIYYQELMDIFPNVKVIHPKARIDVEDNSKRLGGPSTDGISQVKLSKDKVIDTMSAKADDSFSKFWSIYPKKELKKKTEEIWRRKKLNTHLEVILEFINKASATDRWRKGYIKQPPTFLNGECWNDDLSTYSDRQEEGLKITKY